MAPNRPDPPASPDSLSHLFQSNHTPTEAEVEIAASHICELDLQLILLDEYVACRRGELLQSLERYQTILSPIRRLPPEILGEIFTFHFICGSSTSYPSSKRAPWLLAQVCSHWRSVALGTPRMWSMIFAHLDFVGEGSAVLLWKLWLERSGTVPLSVKLYWED
ncbi:hypothetical protein C8J57DRAFT_1583987, partial [Mycena rebaudengoi]